MFSLSNRPKLQTYFIMIKSLLINVLLLTISICGVLFCIEMFLVISYNPNDDQSWTKNSWRVGGSYKLDRELIYSLIPLSKSTWNADEFVEHTTINSYGLRDSEIKERSSYEKRIIVLGDSMTFGHGVNNDQAFPNQLENIFIKHQRSIDVVNAGTKGYGTDQTYKLYLTKLRSLKPDMLIFSIYTNDIYDNIMFPLYTIDNKTLIPLDPTKNWLYILGKLDQGTPQVIRERKLYHFLFARLSNHDWFSVLPNLDDKELIQWSKDKIVLQIAQLQKLGQRDGFQVMVLCIPYKISQSTDYSWLKQKEMFFCDICRDPVWRRNEATLFFVDDYHLTEKGNQMLAQKLYSVLREQGF